MRLIKCGRVYDLGYGAYETIAKIPAGWAHNEVGNACETTRELRRDNASGLFYVCTQTGGYSRSQYSVTPVTREEATKLAEDYLDYDQYVKFFGDPEGNDAGLVRERDAALAEAKDAKSTKDYWYGEYQKRGEKVAELEAKK